MLQSNRKHFILINLENLKISVQNSIQARMINRAKFSIVLFVKCIYDKFTRNFLFIFEVINGMH